MECYEIRRRSRLSLDANTMKPLKPKKYVWLKPKKYVVEWQEMVTYKEEVEANNKGEALMFAGDKSDIVDKEFVLGSALIKEVQQ